MRWAVENARTIVMSGITHNLLKARHLCPSSTSKWENEGKDDMKDVRIKLSKQTSTMGRDEV
jgi:hypothetical protein